MAVRGAIMLSLAIDWYLSIGVSAVVIGIIVAVFARRWWKVVGLALLLVGLYMVLPRLLG